MSSNVEISTAPPKQQGDAVESLVIRTVDGIGHVPDAVAEWFDFVVTDRLEAGNGVPFRSDRLLVERGTRGELKAAQRYTSNGDDERRGRFYVKRSAHEHLLAVDGVYLLAVYRTDVVDALDALLLVPARLVDGYLGDWYRVSSRSWSGQAKKIAWSRFLDPADVEGGDP